MYNKKILIISNNPLSYTYNNGKTILSYFDCLDSKYISQLYFSFQYPEVNDYHYFQITDYDVIKGRIYQNLRGREKFENNISSQNKMSIKKYVGRNYLFLIIRELIWFNSWKSNKLDKWLNDHKPDVIFFVAGDTGFAYNICNYIVKKFNCKLAVYITDDYIIERKKETILQRIYRIYIYKKLKQCLKNANLLITVSPIMKQVYKEKFNWDSIIAVNMSDNLYEEQCREKKDDIIHFAYSGSLYYGRNKTLELLAKSIEIFNEKYKIKSCLDIYTFSNDFNDLFNLPYVYYKGALNQIQLKKELNRIDILVFVESFDIEQIEKTRLSLSTKVPEYLSLKKPILTIGPEGIGSIEYLKDVSFYINSIDNLTEKIIKFIDNRNIQKILTDKAYNKYIKYHNKKKNQKILLDKLLED